MNLFYTLQVGGGGGVGGVGVGDRKLTIKLTQFNCLLELSLAIHQGLGVVQDSATEGWPKNFFFKYKNYQIFYFFLQIFSSYATILKETKFQLWEYLSPEPKL